MPDERKISFKEAYARTLAAVACRSPERVLFSDLNGRILAEDVRANVNSPSATVSLKDGYAVHSGDIAAASLADPVQLKCVGTVAAGSVYEDVLRPGTAVRILSGAPVPAGTMAVLADEFAEEKGGFVIVTNSAEPGRNLLLKGMDITQGASILKAGTMLSPPQIGLLAAAGHVAASVVQLPSIAIIATGDEVIAPGKPLTSGKLYASNLVTLEAWCTHYGIKTTTLVVRDEPDIIRKRLLESLSEHDAILTSGGAWKGDRDLVIRLLDEIGWEKIFHQVRIGPGKAVGFGICKGKPVFCLPGGPPSNHMAFLQIALPALHKMIGWTQHGLPATQAQLKETITGQVDWTQFVAVRLGMSGKTRCAFPLRMASRLGEMAVSDGIVKIPEGIKVIQKGATIEVQLLKADSMPLATWPK